MISIKTSKEIVAGREINNKQCENCGSNKDVYEIRIDSYNSRINILYLCKECLKELKNKIGAED